MSSQDFTGKAVIVTGSSSGIGEATAVLLATKGASVTLCGRNHDNLAAVKLRCQEVSPNKSAQFHTVQGDVRDEKVRERIIDETVAEFGKLDVLVANAGLNLDAGTLEGTTEEIYDEIMNTNVKAVFFLIQRSVPHLEKTKGNVVVVSSPLGERVLTGMMIYSISKAAVDHIVRTISMELAPRGIRVNNLKPGLIPTGFLRYMNNDEMADGMREQIGPKIPMGRLGTSPEVAEAIVFLASDAATYVTGSCLAVDGGVTQNPIFG